MADTAEERKLVEGAAAETAATTESQVERETVDQPAQGAGTEGQGGEGTAPSATATPAAPSPNAGGDKPSYDATFKSLAPGQVIQGKVVYVGSDEVLVDVGYKSEGRIPARELGLKPGETPADVVSVGEEITVTVLKVEDAEGNVVLSKRRADAEEAWRRLEQAFESGEPVEARITERVKGGLVADVGVRGFVPASHMTRGFVEDLDQFVGQTLSFKVIELDRKRRNVVLSRKEILEREYQEAKQKAFEQLREGEVRNGVVKRLTNFGAFVDIGDGVEGLLHVSEMSWTRVKHPSEVVKEGDQIKVMILGVDRERERISLGLRQTLPDPWETAPERYRAGQIVSGVVTRVVDFGAFVKLEEGIEGLVHISQLADRHVAKASDVVSPGQTVRVKVLSVDPAAKRISLSIREAELEEQRREAAEAHPIATQEPAGTTGATIGELVGGLGALKRQMEEAKRGEQS